jgi:hypothetical protein
MHKKIVFLIIVVIYFFGFTGCETSSECPKDSVITLEQEMIDWIQYKPGSYWIYKDSISGNIDSVYVTNFKIERIEMFDNKRRGKYRHCPIRIADLLKIDYETSLGNRYRLIGQFGVGSGVQNNTNIVNGNVGVFSLSSSGHTGSSSLYMFFPPLQGTVGRWAFGWTLIEHDTIFPQYNVLGKNYQNVLRVNDNYNVVFNAHTIFYHVKNIGILRKEIYEINKDMPYSNLINVWELVRYYVIQ